MTIYLDDGKIVFFSFLRLVLFLCDKSMYELSRIYFDCTRLFHYFPIRHQSTTDFNDLESSQKLIERKINKFVYSACCRNSV